MGHAERLLRRVSFSPLVLAGADRMRCVWWSGPGMVTALPVARVCEK